MNGCLHLFIKYTCVAMCRNSMVVFILWVVIVIVGSIKSTKHLFCQKILNVGKTVDSHGLSVPLNIL